MPMIYNNVCSGVCPASCRLKTHVQNGMLTEVKGDPDDLYLRKIMCQGLYFITVVMKSQDNIPRSMT